MSLEEIEKLSKTVGRLLRLLISGGEPFLREDLVEVCKIFIRNNKLLHLTVPTNGFYAERIAEFAEEICSFAPETFLNISLSLDEVGEKRDELVRCAGSFEKLVAAHAKLKKLGSRFKNLFVGVITTQCRENQASLADIYKYAKETLGVDNFALSFARGTDPGCAPDINIYRDFTRYISSADKSNLDFPLARFYEAKRASVYMGVMSATAGRPYLEPCYAGGLRAVISCDGDVFPCETFMFDGRRHKLGNLREENYDFRKIWVSPAAEEARRYIRKSRCFCTHECDLTINALFNLRNVGNIIKSAMG